MGAWLLIINGGSEEGGLLGGVKREDIARKGRSDEWKVGRYSGSVFLHTSPLFL